MTGVTTGTKWLDKVAWVFIIWSAIYLSIYFIFSAEPVIIPYPGLFQTDNQTITSGAWLVEFADFIVTYQVKIIASYLMLNLFMMVMAYALFHRVRHIRKPFVVTLYLTILFHFMRWVVLVVYFQIHGLDTLSESFETSYFGIYLQAGLGVYTAYIIALWFAFRWIIKGLFKEEVSMEFVKPVQGN